jgi:uncharacterized protein
VPAGAASLTVLRAAQRTAVPWKNGGGITREVAVSPAGSALGDFDWRVSIAEISIAGPFSLFPGVERRMAVLEGRLSLYIDGQAAVTLSRDSSAVSFPGDVPVFAEPLGAPATDLNVMTRRGRCSATLVRSTQRESSLPTPCGGTRLLIARSDLTVRSEELEIGLAPLDALLMEQGAPSVRARGCDAAAFDLVEIFK